MGQMLGAMGSSAGAMPTDTSVGYSPQGPPGTPTAESSGGTALGQGVASGDVNANLRNNLSLSQKFATMLGETPEEREKNAKAFSSLVKDIGRIGTSMADSTLMQRMMSHGTKPFAMVGEGTPAGGVAAIPRTFDPSTAGAIMSRLGFK